MSKKTLQKKTNSLLNVVLDAIKDNKGKEIVSLDLREIETAVCDYFVVCHGTSNTHISSLADNIKKDVSKKIKEKPWKIEGENNKEWVLLDYFNIVVHIFNKEKRDFYKLENLWADANIQKV